MKYILIITIGVLLVAGCQQSVKQTVLSQDIVCLLPSLTEDLYALGLGDRIAAVATFCTYPPEAAKLPRVGDCINPNLEAIVRLKPSLVLIGDMQSEAEKKLKSFKLPVQTFRQSTLTDIDFTLFRLGVLFNRQKAADSLIKRMHAELDSIGRLSAGRSKKRVLFVIGRNPGTLSNLFTINQKSFLNELLELAGGVSIFNDERMIWAKVSLEEVIRRNPEVIIETSTMGHQDDPAKVWSVMNEVAAVKQERVYQLSEDFIFIPGPRVVETAKKLYALLNTHDSTR